MAGDVAQGSDDQLRRQSALGSSSSGGSVTPISRALVISAGPAVLPRPLRLADQLPVCRPRWHPERFGLAQLSGSRGVSREKTLVEGARQSTDRTSLLATLRKTWELGYAFSQRDAPVSDTEAARNAMIRGECVAVQMARIRLLKDDPRSPAKPCEAL